MAKSQDSVIGFPGGDQERRASEKPGTSIPLSFLSAKNPILDSPPQATRMGFPRYNSVSRFLEKSESGRDFKLSKWRIRASAKAGVTTKLAACKKMSRDSVSGRRPGQALPGRYALRPA